MCDAQSLIGAYGQAQQGKIEGAAMKAQGDFEAAQMKNMAFLVGANTKRRQVTLMKGYTEKAEQNIASAAISGAFGSHDALEKGNREDMQVNLALLQGEGDSEASGLIEQADMAKINAKHEARAAELNGVTRAMDTLMQAEENYQDSHMADEKNGRLKHFGRSIGAHKMKPFKSFYEPKVEAKK